MAFEQASTVTTDDSDYGTWTAWLAALIGLWVLVSPFLLSGSIGAGLPMWSNVVAGVLIVLFGAFTAYSFRTSADPAAGSLAEWGSWLVGLIGVWLVVSPFVLTGMIGSQTPMWSNVIAGIVVLLLGAFAGFKA